MDRHQAPPQHAPRQRPSPGWPVLIVVLLAAGFAILALVQLDVVIDESDFDDDTRDAWRGLGITVGGLLISGTLLIGGAAVPGLTSGARAALVIGGGFLASPTSPLALFSLFGGSGGF